MKYRNFVYISLFVSIAFAAVFSFDELRTYKGMIKHKVHYALHQSAFAQLGDELKSDSIIHEASYCPAEGDVNSDNYLNRTFEDGDEQRIFAEEQLLIEQQQRFYEPFLEKLSYAECIIFIKDSDGNFVFSNVGYSHRSDAYIQYVYWPKGIPEVTGCQKSPEELNQGSCNEKLSENWTLTYRWRVD